jgi:hypothetical protein
VPAGTSRPLWLNSLNISIPDRLGDFLHRFCRDLRKIHRGVRKLTLKGKIN